MAQEHDVEYRPSAKARKQAEKDQRRMEYRRAIESYCDQRQLLRDLTDYPELTAAAVWQVKAAVPRSGSSAR